MCLRIACQSSSGDEKPGRSAGRTEVIDDINESCICSFNECNRWESREQTSMFRGEPRDEPAGHCRKAPVETQHAVGLSRLTVMSSMSRSLNPHILEPR